jgi:hypothetical protein
MRTSQILVILLSGCSSEIEGTKLFNEETGNILNIN